MSNKLIYFLILVLIIVGAFYFFGKGEAMKAPEINFSEEGNITRDSEESDWVFVYEEPGAPGLNVDLEFGDYSACFQEETEKNCSEMNFKVGDRVKVEGEKIENMVKVVSLKKEEKEDEENDEESGMQTVKIYYYNSELDKDEDGNILCSSQGLVGVDATLPKKDIIESSIQLLIQGQVPEEKAEEGVSTEFPLNGFSLESVNLEDGILNLTFEDPNNESSGGSCRVNVLRVQVEETASQFEGVEEVRIMPETLFQP
jgi:spore germination protein GerM